MNLDLAYITNCSLNYVLHKTKQKGKTKGKILIVKFQVIHCAYIVLVCENSQEPYQEWRAHLHANAPNHPLFLFIINKRIINY